MKLSAMDTNHGADVLVMLISEMQEIVGDDEFVKKLQSIQKTSDRQEAVKIGMLTALDVATYLLKAHRQATWGILGAVEGKAPEEIGKQLLPVTIKQIVDLVQDKEFFSFFQQSAQSEPTE